MRGPRYFLARLRLEFASAAAWLGRVPIAGAVLRRIGDWLVPRGTLAWIRVQQGPARGIWLLGDVRTAADLRRGSREREVQGAIANSLRAGDVFYDLGANLGFYSLPAARQVGPGGKVAAFEPDPEMAERVRRAAERNLVSNVEVVQAAAWSEGGEVAFQREASSPDRGFGHVSAGGAGADSVRVRAIALDEYADGSCPPNLIKCDVEGAEVEVFLGARDCLRKHRPKVICEVHSSENLRALREFFRELGYRVTALETEGQFPVHIVAESQE